MPPLKIPHAELIGRRFGRLVVVGIVDDNGRTRMQVVCDCGTSKVTNKYLLLHGRIDNNGSYEPGNCRWATVKEQGNNRRTNVLVTHNGETLSIKQWAERAGIKNTTFHRRLAHGWSVARAIETPVDETHAHRRSHAS